jgi:hypothetical protein
MLFVPSTKRPLLVKGNLSLIVRSPGDSRRRLLAPPTSGLCVVTPSVGKIPTWQRRADHPKPKDANDGRTKSGEDLEKDETF